MSLHALLLLSDSALPLGSFAFSSGLESFLAHNPKSSSGQSNKFPHFLQRSVANVASTALPYVLTAYACPETLEDLANDFDASTPCTVARRASIAQGKALLAIWERALCPSDGSTSAVSQSLSKFAAAIKLSKGQDVWGLQLSAHFAPLFGAVCLALGLSKHETSYLFLLNHAKTLLSAAVRAGVMGPYQSQSMLASQELRDWVDEECKRHRGGGSGGGVENAAVTVPAMDLWMGRHELLYSRIFNS